MTASGLSQFDQMVNGLLACGVPRSKAESRVREMLGMPAPEEERAANVLEKAEQIEIRKLFIAYGFEVYVLSQPRATKQSPGLPDLYAFHKREPFSSWWESKRSVGGKHSPAQEDFREHCRRTCTTYGTGDRWALAEFLVQYEFAVRGAGQYGIEPVRRINVR